MSNRKTIIKGALILAFSNIFVKIIGVVYIIPLARLIGPEGMGLYNAAFQIYMWLFIICTSGFPIAISKLVSENIAIGKEFEAQRIFKVSLVMLLFIGFASSWFLYYFAKPLVYVIGTSKAYFCLIAISPSLIFISIMSSLRGYFQGLQNMTPTAISQIAEAIVKLGASLLLANYLMTKGIEYSSAGAILGVTISDFCGVLLLGIIYIFHKGQSDKYLKKGNIHNKYKVKTIAYSLLKISLPITLGASIFSFTNMIDLVMIMRRLKSIGFTEQYAIELYGYLTGYAHKIYLLPSTVIIALSISIVPIISAAYAINNLKQINKIICKILKWSITFSFPCMVGILILSEKILFVLFKDSNAADVLRILSFSIVLVATVQISTAIFQGIGKAIIPVRNLLIGAFIKVISNYILIGIPPVNILGAALSTVLCYLVVSILNLVEINKTFNTRISLLKLSTKPFIASAIMGIGVYFLKDISFVNFYGSFGKLIITSLIGALIYMSILIVIGGIDREDLSNMPYFDGFNKKKLKK